jgi:hypothetical protein
VKVYCDSKNDLTTVYKNQKLEIQPVMSPDLSPFLSPSKVPGRKITTKALTNGQSIN